jgi:hypothetical protein
MFTTNRVQNARHSVPGRCRQQAIQAADVRWPCWQTQLFHNQYSTGFLCYHGVSETISFLFFQHLVSIKSLTRIKKWQVLELIMKIGLLPNNWYWIFDYLTL